MKIRYRPEIDGLRTVAVGSVMIYHLDVSVFGEKILRGGFLGVDIFFVISGFLIASLIRQEYLSTGRFSLLDFYERRARRLLPALFTVIAASYVAAGLVLMPTAMSDFAASALASVAFVSNFYWFAESQVYGARSGLVEPLLHTWSLAVEEQFYLIFPLAYVAVLARLRRGLAWLGLAAVGGGFALAMVLTRIDFLFSFYMILSRIWELVAGAVLAHALASRPDLGRGFPLARAMPGLGLVLIVASLLTVSVRVNHPGTATLGAVVGTVLIIWFAHPREPVTRLLSLRPVVAIGLISYSLYLWHYPIYAFGRLLTLMDPGPVHYLAFVLLSFAAATATYYLVERPFRDRARIPRRAMAGTLAAGAVAVAAVSGYVIEREGAPGRLERLTALYGPAEPDNDYLKAASWSVLEALERGAGYDLPKRHEHWDFAHAPSDFEREGLWFDPDRPSHKVLIVGNSHAKDMFNAFHLARDAFEGFDFARFGMNNTIPAEQVAQLLTAPNFIHADTVLVSFRYDIKTIDNLDTLLAPALAADKHIVLLTNTPEFSGEEPYTVVDRYLRIHGTMTPEAINRAGWLALDAEATRDVNRRLNEIARAFGVEVLEKKDFLCNAVERSCLMLTPAGEKVHFDYGHYTLEGAAFLGRRIAGMDWLALLRRTSDADAPGAEETN